MRVFVWTVLLVDWSIALTWLWRVLVWRKNLPRVPDLASGYEPASGSLPRLSVIVPARNEEAGIAATLRSLLATGGVPLEVIAVDDRSTDGTGGIMDAMADEWASHQATERFPWVTLQVLHITDLPVGWLGKTHAMHVAARQATGEWLLFTDGDVLFHPDALRRALRYSIASGADHMVLFPTVLLRTVGERMMIAWLHVLSLWVVRPWRVPHPAAKRDAVGVGAFNMIRREVYDAVGGWASLRLEVVEDLALGRRIKEGAFAQRVAFGLDLVTVRWASGAFGVVHNLTKNLFALFRFRPELLLTAACAMALFTCLPLAMCFVTRAAWWPMGVLLIAFFLAYGRAGKYHHFTAVQMVFYPIASGLLIYALLRSMILALWRGGIYWRGTFYSLRALRNTQ